MANDTVSTTGSIPENLKGLHEHPPKSNVVSNNPTKDIGGLGHDGFKDASPKASVKLTTDAKVS